MKVGPVARHVFEIYCNEGHPRESVRRFVIVEAQGRRFVWPTFGIDEHNRTLVDDQPLSGDELGEEVHAAEVEGRVRQWRRLVCKMCPLKPLEIRNEKLTPIILRLDGHGVSELPLSGLRRMLQSKR